MRVVRQTTTLPKTTRVLNRRFCTQQRPWVNAIKEFSRDLEAFQDYNQQMVANLTKQSSVITKMQQEIELNNEIHPFHYMRPYIKELHHLGVEQKTIEAKTAYFFLAGKGHANE